MRGLNDLKSSEHLAGEPSGDKKMSKVSDLHKKWSHDPEYRATYEELGPEFDLARVLIEVRIDTKLTQAQLAERIKTTQSVIPRNTP